MFPDIANVLCIRDALWRHKVLGSASIMIGAGFSRNADPLSSTARAMPGWSQMAQALCHPLYPFDDARRRDALLEANGTSGFLRLAQEYQAAFGTSSLNDRIRNLVPDTDYRPGDLHKRLLRLPWADMFSTNWDTLLERACTDVFDRSYDVVRTIGEIPFTMRPRIVKLHGSFPGYEPFIFTEEEYRTYPVRFSPFVNLVQQSMMETIFCLVGFSGDDPNFLHWSGWVRDNLGPGAPKIYLVGWLELSIHRRRMLEARNVMPVDLSNLPGADKWPRDLRHRYATEWFIATLERGRPYDPAHWPSPPPSPPLPPPPYLGEVPENTQPSPQNEPFSPPAGKSVAEREEALRSTIEAWAYNRRLYPGWLVAPERVRQTLYDTLSVWMSEFSLLPRLSALDRLNALSELAWRMDRALLPFPSEQEDAAHAALATIDRSARTIDGAELSEKADWYDILRGANTLALSLARNARHAGNRTRFEEALGFLRPQGDHNSELQNALDYEECLWELSAGDLANVVSRLDNWIPAQGETVWSLRKAGLLAEMQDHARACAVLETTLTQIRRARRRDVDDLVSLSLEGWALYLALAYTMRGLKQEPTLPKDLPEPFERWRALGIVDCDAFSDYQALRRLLEADRPRQPEITMTRGFDLDHSGVTHHMARGPSPIVIAAYQMVMLAEVTAIPPATNHVNLFEDGLRAAAKALATDEPWLASQLAVRIDTDDKLLDDVFSRTRIARLPERLVAMLRDASLKRLAFGLTRMDEIGASGRDGIAMVGGALEILSRVAVRLAPQQLRALFEEAVAHYRSPTFRRRSTFLGQPLAHLLARILESLPNVDIFDLLPMLFALPLPNEIGLTTDEYRWRDPVMVLPNWFDGSIKQPGLRGAIWESTVSHLLIAAKGENLANRSASVYRLFELHRWGILTEGEKQSFADALWTPAHLDSSGVPQHTSLRPWVLLIMPEQQAGQAREALLRFIGEQSRQGGEVNNRLAEIGEVLRKFVVHGISFDLPEDVQTSLTTLIGAWALHRPEVRHRFERFMNGRGRELEATEGVAEILSHIAVGDNIFEKIWDKADAMDHDRDGDVRAFVLYRSLARRWPERTAELVGRMRRALVSDQEDMVRAAVRGLLVWLDTKSRLSQEAEADAGLDGLVREVGIGIGARRSGLLRSGLDFARWVFRRGPERLRQLIVRDCDHGLTALLEEASYARSDQTFDVPAIRAACFRLASAMATAGFVQERGVTGWLITAKDDPLPEVRNAEAQKAI